MGFSRQEYWSGVPLPSLFTSLILSRAQTLLPYNPGSHSTGVMVHDSLVHDASVPTEHQLNMKILGKKNSINIDLDT